MYLKELYKSRTVDKYEGYDTIYNKILEKARELAK